MDDTEDKKDSKVVQKLSAVRAVKELSGDSEWTLTQELMQEIVASYTVANPSKLPAAKVLIEDLKKLIEEQYAGNEELKDLLLQSIPAEQNVRAWFKKKNWDETVWSKIRGSGLFTKEKRSQMIEALFDRGMDKSDVAAKIWLTLSGDYSEKMDINSDKNLDIYREIQSVILSKNKKND